MTDKWFERNKIYYLSFVNIKSMLLHAKQQYSRPIQGLQHSQFDRVELIDEHSLYHQTTWNFLRQTQYNVIIPQQCVVP